MSIEAQDVLASANTIAAIDIGANATRLAVAEVLPDGSVELLEELVRTSHQGHDSFRKGSLSAPTVRAMISLLRDFQRTLKLYNVQRVRVVATSAVREAANRDIFVDRVFMATGLDVEVIQAAEESRLTVSAVRQAMGGKMKKRRGLTLVTEVGGGSTQLTVLEGDEIQSSMSLPLGAIRMLDALAVTNEPPRRAANILRSRINNVISASEVTLPLKKVSQFIALGGDMRFAGRKAGRAMEGGSGHRIAKDALDALVEKCAARTPEELAAQYALPFSESETLITALLINQALLRATRAKAAVVSRATMRDGLLLELARNVTGEVDPILNEGVLHSAESLGEKYRIHMEHGKHVAALSVRLFDELKGEHGLGVRDRLLLEVAGLLHEVGGFVSNRGHHKHSYYLVANSEVFGLSREELLTVAHTCRYHRQSPPKPSHLDYMSLPRRQRMIVNRLAALLRVADALDRGHARTVQGFHCERKGDELIIGIPGVADLTLERRALVGKANLFEEIYGLRVRLEAAPLAARGADTLKPAER